MKRAVAAITTEELATAAACRTDVRILVLDIIMSHQAKIQMYNILICKSKGLLYERLGGAKGMLAKVKIRRGGRFAYVVVIVCSSTDADGHSIGVAPSSDASSDTVPFLYGPVRQLSLRCISFPHLDDGGTDCCSDRRKMYTNMRIFEADSCVKMERQVGKKDLL